MKNKKTLAETAGMCGVRFLKAMAANRGRLPDFAKEEIDACSKAIAGDIPWDAWRERVEANVGVDTTTLLALGFRPWSNEGPRELWLMPVWLVPFIPDGFPVMSIDGERTGWKRDEMDTDALFGCIAYGIEVPCPEEGKEGRTMSENGNPEVMREALMDIVLLTVKAGKSLRSDVACGIIASKAKHALSEPPRNCDRFQTAAAVKAQWEDYCHSAPVPPDGWCANDVIDWFFAPVEGKKEYNGSK